MYSSIVRSNDPFNLRRKTGDTPPTMGKRDGSISPDSINLKMISESFFHKVSFPSILIPLSISSKIGSPPSFRMSNGEAAVLIDNSKD